MLINNRAAISALSTVAIAFSVAACKPASTGLRSASSLPAKRGESLGDAAAKKAGHALDQGNPAGAIQFAEASVAFQPDSAERRQLLAQAYLSAGRFISAGQAWREVLQLQPGNAKAVTALALSQIAAGDAAIARRTLAEARAKMPADDLGLALALAGDTEEAIRVLEPVALGTTGTPRSRQNLALAYALAGRWAASRSLAARDLDAATLEQRMESWSRLASAPATVIRVASMLNVIPDPMDSGRPEALALAPSVPQVETAMLEVPPSSVAALAAPPSPPTIVTPPPPAISQAAPLAPQFASLPANVERQPIQHKLVRIELAALPVGELVATSKRPIALTRSTQVPLPATKFAKGVGGGFVVQLGAYRGPSRMAAGWQQLSMQVKPLARYNPVASLRFSPTTGLSFYRLAVGGFPTRMAAQRLCTKVRKAGGQCFARNADRETPIRMALRDGNAAA